MQKLSGGQAAVDSLKIENVRHVFGLIGSATMEMFDALYGESEMGFIGVHDERTGAHMADGYARASGGPGVIVRGLCLPDMSIVTLFRRLTNRLCSDQ